MPKTKTAQPPAASATTASKGFWLVKQEPTSYPFAKFVKDGVVSWTGVRNFQARNHLAAMRKGDQVLYYHSVVGKAVVGIATVTKEAYPDPTAEEGDWKAVELKPVRALKSPVSLEAIKADERLSDILLVRHSRLSVIPLPEAAFKVILGMGDS